MFFGDYALGMYKVNDDYRYCRVDKQGKETLLNDVYAVRNGVYISINGENVGLKTMQERNFCPTNMTILMS